MRQHRSDDLGDEPVSLRRLSRLLTNAAGWTPQQPDLEPDAGWQGGAPFVTPSGREAAAAAAQRRLLLAPRAPALMWLVGAGLAVLLVSGYLLSLHHAPTAVPPAPAAARLPAPVLTATTAGLVVDVGGRVRRPGLVSLPTGARVADAIAAAGGALRAADIAMIDLAARVTDGQLLLIGVPGAAIAGGAGGGPGPAGAPVDLNSATVDQLDALPGVGPVLAQRIVDWRQAHGGFRGVDQLQQVPGIGARKFSDLKALVTA